MPEISFVKTTSVYIKNMLIKQLCNHKLRDFAMAFRVRKRFGTIEKRVSSKLAYQIQISRLVSSVGRAPVCCAGGRRFEPQTGPTLRVLK